jgi:hypothetical protein
MRLFYPIAGVYRKIGQDITARESVCFERIKNNTCAYTHEFRIIKADYENYGCEVSMPSTPNLLAQLIILALLTLGILYVRRKRLVQHGYVILVAVFFNTLSVIIVMFPSVYRILSGASMNLFTVVVVAHSFIGGVSLLAGVYLMRARSLVVYNCLHPS